MCLNNTENPEIVNSNYFLTLQVSCIGCENVCVENGFSFFLFVVVVVISTCIYDGLYCKCVHETIKLKFYFKLNKYLPDLFNLDVCVCELETD